MDAEKRPFLQVEWTASQLGQLLLELGIVMTRDVFDREPFVLAEDQLARIEEADRGLLIDDGEGCPQCVLVGDDPPERPPEGVDVQLRADRRGPGDVVGGAGRRELMRVPEHLLPVRERLIRLRAGSGWRMACLGDGWLEWPARCSLALSASSRIPDPSISIESGSVRTEAGIDLDLQLHRRQ